jgi:predicted nucleic acid-binding protein
MSFPSCYSLAPAHQATLAGRYLAVSITLAEKNWGVARRDVIRRFLSRFTALLPDTATAHVRALIKSSCEKKGRSHSADAWIPAAALQLNVSPGHPEAVENFTILTGR